MLIIQKARAYKYFGEIDFLFCFCEFRWPDKKVEGGASHAREEYYQK